MILAMLVFAPYTADATPVFNDAQSFQLAKAVKLGREKGTSGMVKKKTTKKAKSRDEKQQYMGCAKDYFWNEDESKCQMICDGTTCKGSYEKHPIGDRCYCY